MLTTSVDHPKYLALCKLGWDKLKAKCQEQGLDVNGSKEDCALRIIEDGERFKLGHFRRTNVGRPLFCPRLRISPKPVSTTDFTFDDSMWSELKHNGLADFEISRFYNVPVERGLAIRDPKSQFMVNNSPTDLPEDPAKDLVMTYTKQGLKDLLRRVGSVSGGRKTDLAIRLSVLERRKRIGGYDRRRLIGLLAEEPSTPSFVSS